MATNSELFEIVLNVINKDKVDAAKQSIQQEEEAIRQLIAQLKAGAITQAQFDAATLKSAASIKQAGTALQQMGQRIPTAGLNQIAYAIDDLQYGFKGIANNIQPILMGFQATAAFAGPIAILAIGINALYMNWDSIAKLWGGGHTKTQAEELAELAKQTSLTADEAERLQRAQSVPDKVKQLQQGQTEAQSAQDAAVTKAIIEAGPRDVAAGIAKNAPGLLASQPEVGIAQDEVNKAKKEYDTYKDYPDSTAYADAQDALVRASEKLRKAQEKVANELAATGALSKLFPGGLNQLRSIVDKDVTAFGPNGNQLRKDLGEAAKSPDDIEAEKADDYYDSQERDWQSSLAKWQEDRRQQDEREVKEADEYYDRQGRESAEALSKWQQDGRDLDDKEAKAADEYYDRQEQEYRDKLSQWNLEGDKKIQDENTDAVVKDRVEARNKLTDDRHVYSGAAALSDAIQSSGLKDKTAVEQLAELRSIREAVEKQLEAKQQEGPAVIG